MYKILALPIIDVSAKITKSYFIYKLGLISSIRLLKCSYSNEEYGNQSSSTANLRGPELFLGEIKKP